MNTKHTPGEWAWFQSGTRHYLATPDRGRLYVMGFGRKGMQGASPQFAHWDGIEAGAERSRLGGILRDGPFLDNGSLHPDARLIAAAPDLLNALAVLADVAEARGIPCDAARAAIAKATGESA